MKMDRQRENWNSNSQRGRVRVNASRRATSWVLGLRTPKRVNNVGLCVGLVESSL